MTDTNPNRRFKILLFDDDLIFCHLIQSDLKLFCDIDLKSSFEFNDHFNYKIYDAILVDLDIGPELKGEMIVQFFKNMNFFGPLIILSSDENQSTKLRLLRMGIDDYLWKSMPKEEIQLRIKNAIGTRKSREENSLGNLTLNRSLDLVIEGIRLETSKIEYKLLHMILSKFPNHVSHSELQSFVWNQAVVNKGTVNTLIWQLNKKLASWTYRISYSHEYGIQIHLKE